MAQVRDMTAGNPQSLILRFAIPLMLGNLLQQAYSLIDATIVGRSLGIGALASVGASSSVLFLIIGFCNGCCAGFGIPIAQAFGARDYSNMRRFVGVSLKLAVGISAVLALAACLLCRDILVWMKTPEDIMDGAYAYLLVTFIGIPATFLYNLLASIIRALGDSKTPFWFLVAGTLMNIALDFLFILGFGWGVAGAGIATLVSQAVSAALCYLYMKRNYPILRYGSDSERKFDWEVAGRVLGLGVPMGLQFSITAIGSMMLQSSNNALGTTCVAAFTSAMRIKMFFICPFENLGVAMATYVGQNYGAGKFDRILHGIRDAFWMMLVYALSMLALIWSTAYLLGEMFIDPSAADAPSVLLLVQQFLRTSCSFYIFLGTLCILRYSIQGMGYTKLAMLSGVSEMVARILVSIFAVPAFRFDAVCFGDPVAWIAADCFLIPAFIILFRKSRKELSTENQ